MTTTRQHVDLDRLLAGHPLCITESGLEELRLHAAGRLMMFGAGQSDSLRAVAIESQQRQRRDTRQNRSRAVGVIQIRGTISQHARGDVSASLAGGTATETVSEQLRELLADEEVGRIVLDIDSPGGSSYGVAELAQEIYKARGQKPIVAVANSLAASAAYWLGSQADYFYVTPGGMVGSVGAYAIHQDVSKAMDTLGVKTTFIKAGKFKTLGNEFEPLDDEARSHIQERVDAVYDQFVKDVARGRGVSEATVRNGYGEGDVLDAKRAKTAGMVDGIYTLEQAIARPRSEGGGGRQIGTRAAIAPAVTMQARERLARMAGRARESWTDRPKGVFEADASSHLVRPAARQMAQFWCRQVCAELGIEEPEIHWFLPVGREHANGTLGFAFHGTAGPGQVWIRTDAGDRLKEVVAHECKHLQLGCFDEADNGGWKEIAASAYGERFAYGSR